MCVLDAVIIVSTGSYLLFSFVFSYRCLYKIIPFFRRLHLTSTTLDQCILYQQSLYLYFYYLLPLVLRLSLFYSPSYYYSLFHSIISHVNMLNIISLSRKKITSNTSFLTNTNSKYYTMCTDFTHSKSVFCLYFPLFFGRQYNSLFN